MSSLGIAVIMCVELLGAHLCPHRAWCHLAERLSGQFKPAEELLKRSKNHKFYHIKYYLKYPDLCRIKVKWGLGRTKMF